MHLADVAVFRMAGIGPLDAGAISNHSPGLFTDHLRRVDKIYGVAVALRHFAAVDSGQRGDFSVKLFRLREDRSAKVVESPHDLARQLQVCRLILADWHVVALINDDVGSL